jgi:hypothetical protein
VDLDEPPASQGKLDGKAAYHSGPQSRRHARRQCRIAPNLEAGSSSVRSERDVGRLASPRAGLADYEPRRGDIVRRDVAVVRPRVIWTHDHHELIASDVKIAEARLHGGPFDEAQVSRPRPQSIEDLIRVADIQGHAHTGEPLVRCGKPLRHEVLGDRHACADVKGTTVALKRLDCSSNAVGGLEHLRCQASQEPAAVGQLCAARGPSGQREAGGRFHLVEES